VSAPPLRRLAAHSYTYRDLALDAAVDRIASLGFEAIEMWVGHAKGGPRHVADVVERSGLRAIAVGTGGFYDEEASAAAAAFELAAAIGAPTIVACVSPRALPALVRRLPAELTLCVENHWDQPISGPRDVRRLLDDAPPGRFRACLDTGHALLTGVAPDRFAVRLGGLLGHVHLKDARRATLVERVLGTRLRRRLLPRPAPPARGGGALRLEPLLRALDELDYRGWITVEDEGADVDWALSTLRAGAGTAPAANAADRQT
jgi:sugar phosphate isomerase/epimerase